MSLKAIDMSIAVHKNTDAGMVQRDIQNKPSADQAALAQTMVKTDELSRRRTVGLEESDKSRIRDNRKDKNGSGGSSGQDGEQTPSSRTASSSTAKQKDSGHPFKGHRIDLSI